MQNARCAIATLLLGFALMLWLPRVAWAGVASADSADFTLDTTDAALGIGGVASADSADFTLDTTDGAVGIGGVASADSADFTLDTTDAAVGIGGVASADSADFTLDTTDGAAGIGGVASADSADFTLDTTDGAVGIGGVASADSADFTLDTRDFVDIGLRIRDGAVTLRIGCEPPGTLTSPVRIRKNGTTYGIKLVDPNSPDASPIRIQTSSGTKAWMKLP